MRIHPIKWTSYLLLSIECFFVESNDEEIEKKLAGFDEQLESHKINYNLLKSQIVQAPDHIDKHVDHFQALILKIEALKLEI